MTAPTGLPAAVIGTDVGPLRVYPYGLEWNGLAVTLDNEDAENLALAIAPALELVDPNEKTADNIRSEVQDCAGKLSRALAKVTNGLPDDTDEWAADMLPRIKRQIGDLLARLDDITYELESLAS